MCTKLLPVDQDGDVRENVSAAQPVQVEQDIARMPGELYAAVCCARHLIYVCTQQQQEEDTKFSQVTWTHSSCDAVHMNFVVIYLPGRLSPTTRDKFIHLTSLPAAHELG